MFMYVLISMSVAIPVLVFIGVSISAVASALASVCVSAYFCIYSPTIPIPLQEMPKLAPAIQPCTETSLKLQANQAPGFCTTPCLTILLPPRQGDHHLRDPGGAVSGVRVQLGSRDAS